jgi:hypothetical protein
MSGSIRNGSNAGGCIEHRLLAHSNEAGTRPVKILNQKNFSAGQHSHDVIRQSRTLYTQSSCIAGKDAGNKSDTIERRQNDVRHSVG